MPLTSSAATSTSHGTAVVVMVRIERGPELNAWQAMALDDSSITAQGRSVRQARQRLRKRLAARFPGQQVELVESLSLPAHLSSRLERLHSAQAEREAIDLWLREERIALANALRQEELSLSDAARCLAIAPCTLQVLLAEAGGLR